MSTATEAHNKAIVQRWIDEVFNSGSLAAVDQLKVSSYLDWTPLPTPYQEVDLPVSGIKDALPEWLSGLPDFRFTADRLSAEDEFVVSLGHWQAHHEGTYKGIAATGRRLGGTRIDIFRVAGDKMVEHWGCGNELAFLQLIGALDAPARAMEGDAPEEIGRAFVKRVLGGRDTAALAELLDPHAVDHSGFALSTLALLVAFPDLRVTATEVTTDGDTVVVTSAMSGTHEGPFLGIPATGRRVETTRVDRLRVVDGRIVECRVECDLDAIAAQLGGPRQRAGTSPATGAIEPKELVQRFVAEVLNGKDLGAAGGYVGSGATDHLTGSLTACLTLGGFPDFQLDLEHIIQDGSEVTVLATFSGTHRGRVLDVAPTDLGVTGRVAMSFRLNPDGAIDESWMELEPWTLLQQLGAVPAGGRFAPDA
ncbi:MAG TPA: ester cyclase [Nitriliruptorales bacterium]|nr:ester cyclase [Nitriliruptorales bacterium]